MAVLTLTFTASSLSGNIGKEFTPFSSASLPSGIIAKLFYKILVFRPDNGALVAEKSIESYVDMGLIAPTDGTLADALNTWVYIPPFGDVEIYVYADDDAGADPLGSDPPEVIQQGIVVSYPIVLGYEFKSEGPMRMKRSSKQFKMVKLNMACAADSDDFSWDVYILKHNDIAFPRRAATNLRGVIVEEFSADVYSGTNMNLSDVTPDDLIIQQNGMEVAIFIETESELFASYDIFYLQVIATIIGEVVIREFASKLFPIILSDEVDRVN